MEVTEEYVHTKSFNCGHLKSYQYDPMIPPKVTQYDRIETT